MEHKDWALDREVMEEILGICDELYTVEPHYDENGVVDLHIIFPRLDIIANGISDDGELPEHISKKKAKLLAAIAIMPALN